MTPLTLLHLNTHDLAGGAAKVAWRLAEAQRAAGHRARLLVSIRQSTEEHSAAFDPEPDPNLQSDCRARGQLYYEYQGSHRLIDHPMVQSADLLHLHNLHGEYFNPFSLLLLSRLRPLVWTLHDLQALTGHCAHSYACDRWRSGCGACPDLSLYPELKADTTAQLFRDKQTIYAHSWFQPVAPSRWLQAKAEQGIFRDRPVELIYNGVDTEVFQPYDPAALRRAMNVDANLLLVGCVSNGGVIANHYKGGDYTLAAMQALRRQVPNAVFVNIGAEGESPVPYVLNIPPIRDETELARLLATFDIFLFTSLAENCPLSVLEALACGVPVVTFATGGTPELVAHEQCGLVAEYKNGDALAEALIQLARNAPLRRQFGAQARQRAVEQFDHRRIVAQYEALYARSFEAWQRWQTSGQAGAIPLEKLPAVVKIRTFLSAVASLKTEAQPASRPPTSERPTSATLNWSATPPVFDATAINVASHASESPIDVSIVVATKDRAALLEAMLASLDAAAEGIAYEVIAVVGEGSDGTLEVLGRHGAARRFLETEHLGPGKHSWPQLYNFGFRQARGRWAMFASDDILFEPGCLARGLALLDRQEARVAGGIFFYRNRQSEPGWDQYGLDFTYGQNLLLNYGLIRLAAFVEAGGFDESYRFYCADGDLCFKLYERGYDLIPLPGCLVTHDNVLDAQKADQTNRAQQDIDRYLRRWERWGTRNEIKPRRLLWLEDASVTFAVLENEKADGRVPLPRSQDSVLGREPLPAGETPALPVPSPGSHRHQQSDPIGTPDGGRAELPLRPDYPIGPRGGAAAPPYQVSGVSPAPPDPVSGEGVPTAESSTCPREALALYWQGVACWQQQWFAEAEQHLTGALQAGLRHWSPHWYLGLSAWEAGHRDVARQALQVVAQAVPGLEIPELMRIPPSPKPALTGTLLVLREAGLWREGQPLRLHLGCGERHFDGYTNIDYPPAEHSVQTRTAADVQIDLTTLSFPPGSVAEVRLHHVFEHFDRPTALGLLCRWQRWLAPGGQLTLETPDFDASLKLYSDPCLTYGDRQVILRHLFGSHEARWAIHCDGWCEEKFRRVLSALGFDDLRFEFGEWQMTRNVTVRARKATSLDSDRLFQIAGELLRDSLVDHSESEERMARTWNDLLRPWRPADEAATPMDVAVPPAAAARPPIVSIFIPVYNRERYLPATLESVLAQTFREFEVILADDGSTDRSREIARAYARRDARVRVLELPHQGEVAARNAAVRAAHPQARYLMNHDSDDVSLPTKLEQLVRRLETHPELAIVGCFAQYFDDAGQDRGRPPLEHEPARIRATFGEVNSMVNSAALIRREVFAALGGYREEFRSVDDYDFFARALLAGFQLANLPEVLHGIRLHPDSIGSTRAKTQEALAERIRQDYRARIGTATIQPVFSPPEPARTDTPHSYDKHGRAELPLRRSSPIGPRGGGAPPPYQAPAIQTRHLDSMPSSPGMAAVACVVFSKDRPLQLDGTLRSLFRHGRDLDRFTVQVLYTASRADLAELYDRVQREFPRVEFVRESAFADDLLRLLRGKAFVFFLVDDNIFVRDFVLGDAVRQLEENPAALGVSLRLGRNTDFNYPDDRIQRVPELMPLAAGLCRFDWTGADGDFTYPLEVSSSVYRRADLWPLLEPAAFRNPNTLESHLAQNTRRFRSERPWLLCYPISVTFCAPLNKVQAEFQNRVAADPRQSVESLADAYRQGLRLEVAAFDEFTPRACHQEVELKLIQGAATVVAEAAPINPRLKRTTTSAPLDILHTVEFYAPHWGGAEEVVRQISERLVRRGHRVTVATTRLPERDFRELNGVTLAEFDVRGKLAEGIQGDVAGYQRFLREHPADVVMNYAAQQWATDLAFPVVREAAFRRARVLAPCGYSALADAQTLRWPVFREYFERVLPPALAAYDAVVYHSGQYKDFEFGQALGLANGCVIPNGTDAEEFERPVAVNFRERFGLKTRFLGLCVANFYAGKGQDRVIECVRRMKRADFTMVFVGREGDTLEALRQQARSLESVVFLTGLTRAETVAAFHAADLFLFGSEIEASPLVILEAKASRTPFVSTDCGNVREWQGGIVCDPDELALNVQRLLNDEPLRRQLAEAGWREWKEKFTWDAVVDQWEDLYLRLARAKSGAARVAVFAPAPPATTATPEVNRLLGEIRHWLDTPS